MKKIIILLAFVCALLNIGIKAQTTIVNLPGYSGYMFNPNLTGEHNFGLEYLYGEGRTPYTTDTVIRDSTIIYVPIGIPKFIAQKYTVPSNTTQTIYGVSLMGDGLNWDLEGSYLSQQPYMDFTIYILKYDTNGVVYIFDTVSISTTNTSTSHRYPYGPYTEQLTEVYFDTPIAMTDSFYVAINVPVYVPGTTAENIADGLWNLFPLYVLDNNVQFLGPNPNTYWYIYDSEHQSLTPGDLTWQMDSNGNIIFDTIGRTTLITNFIWGGMFPIIVGPTDCGGVKKLSLSNITNSSVLLQWTPSSFTSHCKIEYMGIGDTGYTVIDSIAVGYNSSMSYTLSGLSPNTHYNIIVSGYCSLSHDIADSNEFSSFTTFDDCHPVENFRILDIDYGCATLSWTRNHQRWQLAYGLEGSLPEEDSVIDLNVSAKSICNLDSGIHYVAYVRGFCPFGEYSPWSEALPFWIGMNLDTNANDTSSIALVNSIDTPIRLSPNPTHSQVTISSTFPINCIELYALNGKRLLLLPLYGTATSPLSCSATLDMSRYPAGTYLLRIHTSNGTTSKKLVVQ